MDDETRALIREVVSEHPDLAVLRSEIALLRAVAEAADNVRHWYFEEPTISNALTLMQRLANTLAAAKAGGAM